MYHSANHPVRVVEDNFDWTVFIDLFATISAIMMLMLGYIAFTKSQSDDLVKEAQEKIEVQKEIWSNFQKKKSSFEQEKALLNNDVEDLQTALTAKEALLEKYKSEAYDLEKERDLLFNDLREEKHSHEKGLKNTAEALRILEAIDDSQEVSGAIKSGSLEELSEGLVVLSKKMQEAEAHKSLFKKKMAPLVAQKDNILSVDDRFILSSEILFPSASSQLTEQGRKALDPIIVTLKDIVKSAPKDLDWIIRIDGHADRMKILRKDMSNRELSAQRSLEIVKYLESQGIPAKRLVATAFGEFHPISKQNNAADFAKDRRIEIKITNR